MMVFFSTTAAKFLFIVASACDPNKTFLGLPVWYKYIAVQYNQSGACDFSNFKLWPPDNLLLIALALLDDLLILAGIVAVFFVIFGGVQYIVSNGEPEKTKGAQSTIINAIIGLVISIVAATVVNYLGFAFAK